jgi:RNase P/RNase MRP subunit POP5
MFFVRLPKILPERESNLSICLTGLFKKQKMTFEKLIIRNLVQIFGKNALTYFNPWVQTFSTAMTVMQYILYIRRTGLWQKI